MRSRLTIVVLMFALLPALTQAKAGNEEIEQYGDWQRQMEGLLNGNDLLHWFSAGVLARRLDMNHAQLRVGLAGRVPNYTVKWQALRSASDDPADPLNLATGTDGWSVGKTRNEEGPGNFVENEARIEIGPEAGAIAITITPVANRNQPAETVVLKMIVLLMDDWVFTTQDFTAPQQLSSASLPNKRLQRRTRSAVLMRSLRAVRGPADAIR